MKKKKKKKVSVSCRHKTSLRSWKTHSPRGAGRRELTWQYLVFVLDAKQASDFFVEF